MSAPAQVLDPGEMRRVLGQFASGVTVVTGTDGSGGAGGAGGADGPPVGFACQSFSSLSLDPPLVLFCPARSSTSWPRMRTGGTFTVNVLASDQEDLARAFARSGGDKFAGVDWTPTPWGPSLPDVLATVHCDLHAVHEGGDHEIVVGAVRQLVTHRECGPLVFFRGEFGLGSPWA